MTVRLIFLTVLLAWTSSLDANQTVTLQGRIVDSDSGAPIAARIYLRSSSGSWHFARSSGAAGSAVHYRKQRGESSIEMHTSLSAHPFEADLPPDRYTLTVERGKEYLPVRQMIDLRGPSRTVTVRLQRWIDMSAEGWYSGETHVHRGLDELPNLIVAEDLNVALPLTYWVTRSDTPPGQGNRNAPPASTALIEVDPTHVIYPLNTEYEIFTVGQRRHTLGAIFALNHKSVFQRGVPPVRPIARQVHREGGLLELDKHNWPWSMMLVPVMNVDLYELTNNHIWRTEFAFGGFGEAPADYMQIERDAGGMTEQGWIDFTFQNYYALLNCGYRLRPTGGTASGVHPVPLGFGRVYVQLAGDFSYDAWMKGLDAGRSFVSTGPMLTVELNDQLPGTTFALDAAQQTTFRLQGLARSAHPLSTIEIVAAGQVLTSIRPANAKTAAGAYQTRIDESFSLAGSSWIAVRCLARTPEGRPRFAHTAPFHVEMAGAPLRPRRREVEYLANRVKAELARHEGVLPEEALQEYRDALAAYQRLLPGAR